ncbi:MAG: MerR family transcriptional regulator [Lachnospiraceae bacterium]|nr:MerR family transcriptional regulator [Lachnospiraceae bacterium]MDD3616219.1 MerR family transcriptional regulator [Lachnospiraceae bacterium]
MQKNRIPCIKTGEFAKLCGTNKRTLIHYDEIGLFSPAYTNELGYRYYSEDQCDVFNTIVCLKDIGMPLKEIKGYIEGRNPQDLKKLLREQHEKIKAEIAHLNRIDQVIETKIHLVDISDSITANTVILEYCPEEYLILSPPVNSDSHDIIIPILYEHIAFCNKHQLNTGHPYGAMIDKCSLKTGAFDTYAYFFTKVSNPPVSCAYYTKPAGNYVTTYLKGNYYEAESAYQNLLHYMETAHLEIADYSYKEAILDEVAVKDSAEFLTKISILVQ